jgi:hypothetical protein
MTSVANHEPVKAGGRHVLKRLCRLKLGCRVENSAAGESGLQREFGSDGAILRRCPPLATAFAGLPLGHRAILVKDTRHWPSASERKLSETRLR